MLFQDRTQAGRRLAEKIQTELQEEQESHDVVVVSIPRGGVVVGKAVADMFGSDHQVVVTKKMRSPGQEELAIGAVGNSEQGVFINDLLVAELGIGDEYLRQEIAERQAEVRERLELYDVSKEENPQAASYLSPLKKGIDNKTVIIVDDGIATGATMIAAIREIFGYKPHRVIVAVPVIAKENLPEIENEADAVIFLQAPDDFFAVGQFYQVFEQVTDDEVVATLKKS